MHAALMLDLFYWKKSNGKFNNLLLHRIFVTSGIFHFFPVYFFLVTDNFSLAFVPIPSVFPRSTIPFDPHIYKGAKSGSRPSRSVQPWYFPSTWSLQRAREDWIVPKYCRYVRCRVFQIVVVSYRMHDEHSWNRARLQTAISRWHKYREQCSERECKYHMQSMRIVPPTSEKLRGCYANAIA